MELCVDKRSVQGIQLTNQILRYLNETSKSFGLSLRRLSSGQRIQSAQEGAVDLVHIQSIDNQMRGYRASLLNVNETLAISEEAESSLNSMLELGFRLREVALKGRDSSLTSTERTTLQNEANGLVAEFGVLANQTGFNNQKLLDGSYGTKSIFVGFRRGDTVNFSLGDARTSTLGRLAIYSGAQGGIVGPIDNQTNILTLNGVTVFASMPDQISTSNSSYSSIAIAAAINDKSAQSNVYAETLTTERTIVLDSGLGNFTQTIASGELKINNVNITGSSVSSASRLVTVINGFSSSTGAVASVDSSGNVKLSATDGRNIQVVISNSATNNLYDWFNVSSNSGIFSAYSALSQHSNQTHVGTVRIWSSAAITVAGANASQALGITAGTKDLVFGTSVAFFDVSSAANADEALKTLDVTIQQISTQQADVSAFHSRLDMTSSVLISNIEAAKESRSKIGDADFAEETLNVVKMQFLANTAKAALSHSNIQQAVALQLLSNLN